MEFDTAELTKIAEGSTAEIFSYGRDKVIRIANYAATEESSANEKSAIDTASEAGLMVAQHLGYISINNCVGQIMQRLDGPDLTQSLEDHPWQMRWIYRRLGHLHAQMHSIKASRKMFSRQNTFQAFNLQTLNRLQLPFLDKISCVLKRLNDGDCLTHGDFHPGNIMNHKGQLVIIDWPTAAAGSAESDVARSLMMIDLMHLQLKPGSGLLLQGLVYVTSSVIRRSYLSAYRKSRHLCPKALKDWYTAQLLN